MKVKPRSIEQIVDEQVKKWRLTSAETKPVAIEKPVVTISREPGSGGKLVAARIAEKMSLDLFHHEVIHAMAQSADISSRLAETLDEKGLSVLENWIASLVDDRHLWPDQYMRHLMKVLGTIGKHGAAVIVGRGANFILTPQNRLRVRVVAPLESRIENVSREYDVPALVAKRRIVRTESDRRAFVRKYFHADIADPINYDMVLNTAVLSLDACAGSVRAAMATL